MDTRADQQASEHQSQPVAFSLNLGSDQEQQMRTASPSTPTPPTAAYAPSPLAPSPGAGAHGSVAQAAPPAAGPQHTSGYGQAPMPSLPQMPPQPGFAPVVQRLPERTRGPLGKPFPLPLTLLVGLGCVAFVAAVFGARVVVLGGDWSEGAVAVGTVALLLAAVVFLVTLLRVAAGRRSLGFLLLSLLLLVTLAVTGFGSLASIDPLHQAQAQAMETSGQWSTAIHEYSHTGQQGPNAPDIARVYDEWGESLLQQGDYKGALSRFQTVLDDYAQSGDAVVRAQKDQFLAYAAWLKHDPTHVPYRDAIITFVNYASNAGCTGECKATLAAVTPQAYYLYGMQLMGQKQYARAVVEFGKLAKQYGSSSYAKQAHAKAATAYFAYGQQQISSQDCAGAVTSYETLVASYKDTPEASRARTALSAPQNVTGFLVTTATNPLPTVHLSKSMNFDRLFFSEDYSASIDPKTGAFTFKQVALGTYYVSTSRPIGGGSIDYEAWWADEAHTRYFAVTVTPLCATTVPTLRG